MHDLIRDLHPAYKPPSRQSIAGPLLDQAYTNMKEKVDHLISSMPFINVVTDESSNINHARISNISIISDYGSLHCVSEDIGARKMDASGFANWLKNHLLNLTNGNLR